MDSPMVFMFYPVLFNIVGGGGRKSRKGRERHDETYEDLTSVPQPRPSPVLFLGHYGAIRELEEGPSLSGIHARGLAFLQYFLILCANCGSPIISLFLQ